MTNFVGLDVAQKMTAICVVDEMGRKQRRGQCPTVPAQIAATVRRQAGGDVRIGIETGAMTPWLMHELRSLGLEVICLDARHARAALKMQINKTDRNDAEDWLKSFAPAGSDPFMSSRSIATAHARFSAQGLNLSA